MVAAPAGRVVRILDRYLLREFALYLALGLGGFIAIFIVVDLIDKIAVFLDHDAPFLLIARFYLFRAPEVVVQVFPVALLLATFLALGQLNKFGELTAMRSSGISLGRILAPVFGVAAVSALVSLAIGEMIVPYTNRERDRIYDQQIQDLKQDRVVERPDLTYLGRGGRIFYMRTYHVDARRMDRVTLQEFEGGRLSRRIDAAEAVWQGAGWVFRDGYVRTFDGERETARPFAEMAVDGIAERPDDFAKEVPNPDEMNYADLRAYVERLRASGARVDAYLVDLHLKLAFPLVNLIVVMIGASLATRLRMQSAALGFGLSVGISFVYYAFMRAGQALGHTGTLEPYLAAWLGDLVFGAAGLVMMVQAQRR